MRQRWFNMNDLEVAGDEIIGLQYGQDDADEPESDEEDGGKPLSRCQPSQFLLAEEAGVTTNQEDADGHHRADRVRHHGEARGACGYFKRFALKSKTKIQPHIILMRRNIVTVSKAALRKLWRDRVERKMGFTKHLNDIEMLSWIELNWTDETGKSAALYVIQVLTLPALLWPLTHACWQCPASRVVTSAHPLTHSVHNVASVCRSQSKAWRHGWTPVWL